MNIQKLTKKMYMCVFYIQDAQCGAKVLDIGATNATKQLYII